MKKIVLIFSLLFCIAAGSVNAGAQKLVAEKDSKKGLWGYKTPGTDKWVVKPKYNEVMPFVTVNDSEVAFAKTDDVWEEVDANGKVLQKFTYVKPYTDSSKFIFAKKGSDDFSWGYIGTDSRPSSEKFNYTKDFKNISSDNFIAYAQDPNMYSAQQRKLMTLSNSGKYNELFVDEVGGGYLAKYSDGSKQIFDDKGVFMAQFKGEMNFPKDFTDEKEIYRFPIIGDKYEPKTMFYITPDKEVVQLFNGSFVI